MSSEIFELLAQDDVRFLVHKDILTHQSQPFADATCGVWKESTDRKIHLRDWDAKTVGRLVQFLYTGDYKYPDPSSVPDIERTPKVEGQAAPKPAEEPQLHPATLTPLLECVLGDMPERAVLRMTDCTWLECVDTSSFDFEESFLAHSKVYTLAHYKSIAALKAFAQGRLARVLLAVHPLGCNPHLTMNITKLATYVYENTDSLECSAGPLRNMVSQFFALNFPAWQADPVSVELMCGGGDFVKDVLAKLCRRLGVISTLRTAAPATRYINSFGVG
ncbi:hypothetical protein Q9L58_009318 [Maublancomyces gigas]|uniref:BTB domain-containing protein n=1 Tax=Discina gigas TaxID=1032678 RepID=A0ABR3G7L5_9PEZI